MFVSPFPDDVAFEWTQYTDAKASSFASTKRAIDFENGRLTAHRALKKLDIAGDLSIGKGDDGSPLWPKGIVGSISHSGEVSVAAVALESRYKAIGVDIQEIRPITRQASFAKRICTKSELLWTVSQEADVMLKILSIFSAKETIYKALSKFSAKRLLFADAELRFEGDHFQAKIAGFGDAYKIYLIQGPNYVITGMAVEQLAQHPQCDN